jgi:hypothetical protein
MNTSNFNLQVMDESSMIQIYGGGSFTDLLKKITPVGIAIWVADNWSDVKKGLSDGWNETKSI